MRRRLAAPAEDLAWIASAASAVLLAAAFIWFAPPLSHLYPSPLHDEFPIWRVLIDPEPLEEVRAILALGAPVAVAAIVLVVGVRQAPRRGLDPLVIAIQAVAAALLLVAVHGQPRGGALLPPGYFEHYLISNVDLVAGFVLGLVATALLIRPPAWNWSQRLGQWGARLSGWRWLALVLAIAATVIWLLPAVNTDDTVTRAGSLASGHIPTQAEDYFATANGRTPLVDYISQYSNLLPIAVEPVLRAAGLSITSFSITACALTALGMIAIYGMFALVTRGLWRGLALYVPWVAFSLYPWHDAGPYREFNGIYPGVLPGRDLGPFVLAFLAALALRRRRPPLFAVFVIAGLVVLNNYEFGIAALFALVAAVGFGRDHDNALGPRWRDVLLQGAAGLATAFVLVCCLTILRTGSLPDLSLLTYYNRLFLRDSYGLEPMSFLGVHWALYATYGAALVTAAVRYVRREPDAVLTGMLAFSAVFGLVTAMYFVGRSSQYQLMLLFPAWGLSLALVAWTAARSLRSASASGIELRRLIIPASAALIGFGVMGASISRIPSPRQQIDRLSDGGQAPNFAPAEQLVRSWTRPGENVFLLALGPDHLVADQAGVVNTSPFNGVTSLISPAEADRALDSLQRSGGDLVIERVSALPTRGGFVFAIPQLGAILRGRGYRLLYEDPVRHIRVWRRTA